MNYPVKFDKCPACGGEKRLAKEAVAEEKLNLDPGAQIAVLVTQTPLFDPNKVVRILAPRKVTVLIGYYDVCADCGTFYCVEMQKQEGMVSPQQGGNTPQGKGHPPAGTGIPGLN